MARKSSLARDWAWWASSKFANLAKTKPEINTAPRYFGGPKTAAGVYVTPDRALTNATVWACVNYLSKMVAQLPWQVMLPRADEGADRQTTHPVNWVLNTRPCPDMSSFTWRQSMLGNALLWGNGYAEIERDIRQVPVALWPIHPCRVIVERGLDGLLVYKVTNRGSQTIELSQSEMFHIRGFGDGPVGYSIIEYAAQTIGWAQATELFGSTYFGEGMNPTGVISVEKGLSVEAAELLRNELERVYMGPKAKRTAILDAGMKWEKMTNDPESSQFVSSMQHQVETIARFFGIPPHKIGHLLRATFSNIEQQAIEVVVDTLIPWVKVFELEADYKLFGQNRQGFFTKLNVNGLLRGDSAARAQLYKAMFEMGAISPNEVMLLEDRNPIGPEGDQRYVSTNLQTLENAKILKTVAEAKPKAPVDTDGNSDANEAEIAAIRFHMGNRHLNPVSHNNSHGTDALTPDCLDTAKGNPNGHGNGHEHTP